MFATKTSKKILIAILLSGALMAPAEANGWKFHVLGAKVELGNKGPITVQPPKSVVPDPTIMGAAAVINGVSSWFTAPGDIRKSIDRVPITISDEANKFYRLLSENIEWLKGLVTSYGLATLLGLAATMFLSATTAAYIIGRFIRSGLLANQLNVPKTAA